MAASAEQHGVLRQRKMPIVSSRRFLACSSLPTPASEGEQGQIVADSPRFGLDFGPRTRLGARHRRSDQLVEAIPESTTEVADVESPLDRLSRALAIQMERNVRLSRMLPRYDVVLSRLHRLSAARTDERHSLVHQTLILANRRVLPDP